uniref:AN1-type domain-containing protein n=1 Tax=Spumella elongata TaxID=89044 RepID=A0A7S3GPS3_9STRA|mmetsp:Transcript_13265/g.23295  ORF Transcript_13265/g.23295 Transcript_13265/m.23295 type:complete len:226 (+) Transcript_13265:303-980(+)
MYSEGSRATKGPGCDIILGPSNKFTCNKCHMNVCLAHRIPEEHSCVGPIRKDFLEKVQKNMKVGNADPPAKKRHETQHVGIFHHCDKDDKEKAKKRHQEKHPHTTAAPAAVVHQKAVSAAISCPFCGLSHESEAVLADHILAFHSEESLPVAAAPVNSGTHHTTTGSASHQAPAGASALHREVCPLCHVLFPDAISLVRYFEASHSERSQYVRYSSGSTNHYSLL